MMMLLLAVLSALAPQESRIAARSEKSDYSAALAKYKEAEGLVETDPLGAIDKLTEIITNPKIRIIECILKIEQRIAEYTDPYPFLPYQMRGTARVNQSKKLSGEPAQKMMTAAIDDYTESVKRNVGPSGDLLKAAQARLTKLKEDVTSPPPLKADPVLKFREKWEPVIRDGRYKTARALVDKEGQELTDEQRKGFVATGEQQCRDFLVREVAEFRPRFVRALGGEGLATKTPDEFELTFALPAPDELIVTLPAIEWARQYLPAFRDVQSQKSPAHSLAAAAVASAPIEDRFENPWFKAVEGVVFQSLKSAIESEVERARDAGKADRDKARALANGYMEVWKGMTSKLDPKFVERHRFLASDERTLTKLFDGFPMELADLEKIDPALEAAFGAENPDAELSKIEGNLDTLLKASNLSRESRQLLYTAQVTVVALRGLLGGKSEEAVAGDLSAYRSKLREAGGAGDVRKYGPRVEKVFAALR